MMRVLRFIGFWAAAIPLRAIRVMARGVTLAMRWIRRNRRTG